MLHAARFFFAVAFTTTARQDPGNMIILLVCHSFLDDPTLVGVQTQPLLFTNAVLLLRIRRLSKASWIVSVLLQESKARPRQATGCS